MQTVPRPRSGGPMTADSAKRGTALQTRRLRDAPPARRGPLLALRRLALVPQPRPIGDCLAIGWPSVMGPTGSAPRWPTDDPLPPQRQAGRHQIETASPPISRAALDDDRIGRRARNGSADRGDISGVRLHTGSGWSSSARTAPDWTCPAGRPRPTPKRATMTPWWAWSSTSATASATRCSSGSR